MDVFCIDSVDIDSIECIRDPSPVLTVLPIYSNDGIVEKSSDSACQNFLWIENQLNIKKVIVCMCFDSSIDSLNKHSIQCIACFDLHIDSVDKQHGILNTQ